MVRNCLSCRWWCGHMDVVTAQAIPGQCRALPPGAFGWPETRGDDWCGAHAEHVPDAAEMGLEARKG
jgi:hypothetical protein